jgi:hypothetical protein
MAATEEPLDMLYNAMEVLRETAVTLLRQTADCIEHCGKPAAEREPEAARREARHGRRKPRSRTKTSPA